MLRPHEITLCQLVNICAPRDCEINRGVTQSSLNFLLHELNNVNVNSTRSPPLSITLQRIAASFPGQLGSRLANEILKSLQMISSPDDLMQFFIDMRGMIAEGSADDGLEDPDSPALLSPRSVLGVFVRQCVAKAAAMSFEATCRLWEEVVEYTRDDMQMWSDELGSQLRAEGALRDSLQLEHLLNLRIAEAERPAGASRSAAVEQELEQLGDLSSILPKVHLLRHIRSTRSRDAIASSAHLHAYFDYTNGRQRPSLAALGFSEQPLGGGGLLSGAAATSHNLYKNLGAAMDVAAVYNTSGGIGRFQSALLSLTTAHASLGETSEAMQALEEGMHLAQQAMDPGALAHALAALCRLGVISHPCSSPFHRPQSTKGTPGGPSGLPGDTAAASHTRTLIQILERCLARGQDLKLPHLVAYARLALAQLQLQHGACFFSRKAIRSACRPAAPGVGAVVQELARLQHLCDLAAADPPVSVHSTDPVTPHTVPFASNMRGVYPSTKGLFSGTAGVGQMGAAVRQLAGEAHVLAAESWSQHGCPELSACHAVVYSACYPSTAKADDLAACLSGVCRSVGATRGAAHSRALLQVAGETFQLGAHPKLSAAAIASMCDEAAHRGEAQGALEASARMRALAPIGASAQSPAWIEAEMAHARALMAAGDHVEAEQAARILFNECVAAGQEVACARLLGLMGRCRLESGSPVLALPYLLTCLEHCKHMSLEHDRVEAGVGLAELWCSLGEAHVPRALSMLRSLLPFVLVRGALELRARAQLCMARSMLMVADRRDVIANPQPVLRLLGSSAECYSRVTPSPDWQSLSPSSHNLPLCRSGGGGSSASAEPCQSHVTGSVVNCPSEPQPHCE